MGILTDLTDEQLQHARDHYPEWEAANQQYLFELEIAEMRRENDMRLKALEDEIDVLMKACLLRLVRQQAKSSPSV